MHVRPHPLEHVLDELPMVLKRWIVVNRLKQCLAINGRSFGEILHHVHLDDVPIRPRCVHVVHPNRRCPETMFDRSVPEFPEMPLVSFFPQEVAFLERKQVGELSDVPCRRVRGGHRFGKWTFTAWCSGRSLYIGLMPSRRRRVRLPRLDAPNVRGERDVHQGPCPSCDVGSAHDCQDTN